MIIHEEVIIFGNISHDWAVGGKKRWVGKWWVGAITKEVAQKGGVAPDTEVWIIVLQL